jgi:uncharacterized membrane protein YraQ (UPF0718 family)
MDEKKDEDWVDEVFSETNEEKMTSFLNSIATTNASSLGKLEIISEKVLKASLNSWKYDEYFKHICKTLSEIIADAESNPIHKCEKEITKKILDLKDTLQLHTEIVEAQNRYIVKNVDEIKNEFSEIKKEVKRPRKLIPFLLIAILIVLLIK